MKRAAAVLVLASIVVACKEEWNRNQLGVANPYTDTEETEPTDDDPDADATTPTTSTPIDAAPDTTDARPADARTDARDATPG